MNVQQQKAVEHFGGPLLVAAGAGSGKTKTLTSRIAFLLEKGILPERILAITFTNKAAEEMKSRIFKIRNLKSEIRNPMFIGTFHSLGARILKKEGHYFGRTAGYTIFDNDDSLSLIRKVMKEMDISKEQVNSSMVEGSISRVKNELWEEPSHKIGRLIYHRYEEALAKNNAFDFDDLIQKVVLLFRTYPDVAKKYQEQWDHVLVDEFQDINTAQYELIKSLAGGHRNLSVVGDDAQAIYGFRYADFRNFLNFERDWPGAKLILLEENYRSTANIISAANRVIKNNKLQKPKSLWTANLAGELIRVMAAKDENEEAEWVVDKIKESGIGDQTLKNVAILYRTNAQSRAVEQNLIVNQIPYKIFGGIRFYERKEIKDLVAALRLASNPKDSVSAERLLKNLPKKTALFLIPEMSRKAKELNLLELINFFLKESDYFEQLEKSEKNASERIENINELIVFAGTFFNKEIAPENILSSFLEQVSLMTSADKPANRVQMLGVREENNFVNLMSIHLAKGLEFDNVFVIGCKEGTLPHHRSYDEPNGVEEERRLMYVAMTRARHNLFLTFTDTGSRFLYEIPPELIDFTRLEDLKPKKNLWKLGDDEEMDWIEYD